MKTVWASAFILMTLSFFGEVDPTFAAWPVDEILVYECEQALVAKKDTGWACMIVEGQLGLAIYRRAEKGSEQFKKERYERNLIRARYAQAGGLKITTINKTVAPETWQICTRPNSLETFHCRPWEVIPDSEKF